jgi:hypothetical protein
MGSTTPEFQIINESTVAAWINTAEAMAGNGLGWTGSTQDVKVDQAALGAMVAGGNLHLPADHLDLLLLGGRMTSSLRTSLMDAVSSVYVDTNAAVNRARAATFLVLASPEFVSQP